MNRLLAPLAVALVAGAFGAIVLSTVPTPALERIVAPPTPQIAGLFTPEVQRWQSTIAKWAGDRGLDPNLVATVMQIESCGNPQATSSAGASGLFQVMPDHFAYGEDAYDPAINAMRGMDYLQSSLQTAGGDIRLAFAGYNGGIGVIALPETDWADETRHYAYWGEGIYADAALGANHSSRLDEWLSAGGSALCQQASLVPGP